MEPTRRVIVVLTGGEGAGKYIEYATTHYRTWVRPLFPGAEQLAEDSCLRKFVVLDPPSGMSALEFAVHIELDRREAVQGVYAEPLPVPPPAARSGNPPKPPSQQRYLNAAPMGIGVEQAWKNTSGAGVRIVDVEQGWTLDHEDILLPASALLFGTNHDYFGHGTAVLGIIASRDDGKGCTGIVPDATVEVVSEYYYERGLLYYSTARAIWEALKSMAHGEILLVESQTDSTERIYVPVEVDPAVRCVIDYATKARDVVVIEAAGNGKQNIDSLLPIGTRSDAVIVASADSATPHDWNSISNFGKRVDCFAWGDSIATCGTGKQSNSTTVYTKKFGGTSGAAAIVAGVAGIIQALAMKAQGAALKESQVRQLLSTYGTASGTGAKYPIGVMPDLAQIIPHI